MIFVDYTLCLIIIIKSEVWTIIHCLGLGHETMLYVVCISIFLDMLIFLYAWIFVIQQYGTLSFYIWNQRLFYFDLSFTLHSTIIDLALDRWQEIVVLILDGKQQANGFKTRTMCM